MNVITMRSGSNYDGLDQLAKYIKNQIGDKIDIIEIGSYQGESTEIFANNFPNSNINAVDIWEKYIEDIRGDGILSYDLNRQEIELKEAEEIFSERIRKFQNVKKNKISSLDFCQKIDNDSIDLVYIDGNHQYSSVKEDILNWLPKIKQRGIISGHDYPWESVKKALIEIFDKEPDITFIDGSWLYKVNSLKHENYDIIENDVNSLLSKVDLTPLKNKRILITGSSGLLGVYFTTCLRKLQKEYNIEIYLFNKNGIDYPFNYFYQFDCKIIEEDITEYDFKNLTNFDVIIHAAGYGQPGKFMENKIKTFEINTRCTLELLKKLNTNGKFLFISTSELYSGLNDNANENLIGSTNTDHPRACYIESKKGGETICNIYRDNGYDVKSARLSLAYGPGTKIGDGRVLNNFIEKSIKTGKLELMDSGNALRTYCYITDVIEMMWNILLYGKNNIYNVGGESVITIYELAKLISSYLNVDVILPEINNSVIGNPSIVNMDISRYIDEFKRPYFVSMDDGIKNTIGWQKYIYSL